ncbi:NAD-binding protein [Pholiota conissans]|uniref:NAD-binding protein n=1 Tax=Pholiota conissans TaxID=109636 RepID=A0A9P5ZD26_9AGAR|nr:NAD-binding protein [Pholiota conissans]
MKIAIAGCNGRIGRRVVKLALERGNTVVGIDMAELPPSIDCPWLAAASTYTFEKADLLDYDTVLRLLEGCDAVINLAGYPNPVDYKVKAHNSNVVINWNILRACGELGINRVALASSVNVITMVYSQKSRVQYFPIDEDHPCEPDEPYGLSKVICEMQADSIIRRYETMRIASLRLHWSVPNRFVANKSRPSQRAKDLWGYVQEDSGAEAFLLALQDNKKWSGHERFFITGSETAFDEQTLDLIAEYWPDVPIKHKEKLVGRRSLFDCSKAVELLGWQHKDGLE